MMSDVLSIQDFETLFRPLKDDAEKTKAEKLIDIVFDILSAEAEKVGKDLNLMMEEGTLKKGVLQSVMADVVGRTLMTSTDQEPVSQFSQSALGYSVSGTYLVPGGGVYLKKSELSRLGLRKQRYGVMDIYGLDQRD